MADRDRLLTSLPRLDCAACGAPTCDAFADDVVRGEATEDACVFVRERRVEALVAELFSLLRQRTTDRGGH
jgi:Na+-translocating ferredoxin:NAD+ oxidoreductase RNF subunit RnfB